MRVLVTGARGFLGTSIAQALDRRRDVDLVRLVRQDRRDLVAPDGAVVVDLTDEASTTAALETIQPDIIIHAAGKVHGTPLELFRDNTVATVVLAEAVLRASPSAVLTVLGSAAEYGRPIDLKPLSENAPCRPVSPYGHSKLGAASYLLAKAEQGLRCNILRVFNPIGQTNTDEQVLGAFISKAVKLADSPPPRRVAMGRLDAVRDFVAVDDLLQLIVRLIDGGVTGQIINVCSGEGHRVRDLIQSIISVSRLEYVVEERGDRQPTADQDIVVGDPTRFMFYSGLKAPTPIKETLAKAWQSAVAARSPKNAQHLMDKTPADR
jgi:GDP-4-dehydro-6-deoxy-D-mannose reductase